MRMILGLIFMELNTWINKSIFNIVHRETQGKYYYFYYYFVAEQFYFC